MNLDEHYDRVIRFNKLANKLEKNVLTWEKDWKNQLGLVKEEFQELIVATEDNNLEGIIDGLADVFVTYSKLLHLVKLKGVDIDEALQLVCENNMTKIISDVDVAEQTMLHYQQQGLACYVDKYEGGLGVYYTVKRLQDQKILKPLGFKSVDLSGVFKW
jgi:phosphoribosyl-ATP pyrophosphohydrolase